MRPLSSKIRLNTLSTNCMLVSWKTERNSSSYGPHAFYAQHSCWNVQLLLVRPSLWALAVEIGNILQMRSTFSAGKWLSLAWRVSTRPSVLVYTSCPLQLCFLPWLGERFHSFALFDIAHRMASVCALVSLILFSWGLEAVALTPSWSSSVYLTRSLFPSFQVKSSTQSGCTTRAWRRSTVYRCQH